MQSGIKTNGPIDKDWRSFQKVIAGLSFLIPPDLYVMLQYVYYAGAATVMDQWAGPEGSDLDDMLARFKTLHAEMESFADQAEAVWGKIERDDQQPFITPKSEIQ